MQPPVAVVRTRLLEVANHVRAGSIRSGTAERIVLQPINVLCGNGDIGHRGRLVTTGLDFPADGPGTEEPRLGPYPLQKFQGLQEKWVFKQVDLRSGF